MSSLKSNSYTILCIDDNKNNLFTLNALLGHLKNIETIEVLGAKEALDVLLRQSVDLILCDVQMPDINGFELAKMIKSNKKTKDIPIIFVTAVFKSEEFIKYGFEIGAIDYITKPIDDNQLLNKISLYLKIFEEKNHVIESEKRLYGIAQSSGDGIYTLDLNYQTTFINNEALRLLGFSSFDLMGKKIHEYIHYKDKNNHQILSQECTIHRSIREGEEYRNEDEYLVKKDGSFLVVSIVATPLYDERQIVGVVVVFRDKSNQNRLELLEHEKVKNQEQIIHSMVNMIESRDSYTAGHTKRVAKYCVMIAQAMNYSDEDVELLKNAAWLHDIGKIFTPDSILLKPDRLQAREYKLIQDHLNSGYEMLKKIDQYSNIADIMREHHERYDGHGYPQGLKAQEIRPLSQIMIVADAFDAMTTNRIYKPRKSVAVALQELEELSTIQFHPNVVTAAIDVLKDVELDLNISQLPQTNIEEQRFSYFYRDRLTNLFIIEYLEPVLRYYIKSNSLYIYKIKLHNFSEYNRKFSWKQGDLFLVEFSIFIDNFDSNSIVFRVEGDDFIILSEKKIEDIKDNIDDYINSKKSIVSCSVSEEFIESVDKNIDKIFKERKE